MKKSLLAISIRITLTIVCFGFCFFCFGQAPSSTTWTITAPETTPAWDNGEPNNATDAVIAAPFISGETNLTAHSLTITNNATVNFSTGTNVTLNGALVVDSGSSATFENNAILIQEGSTNTNSGTIIMKRESSLLKRLDYTLWSSPVTGSQTLLNFSPLTLTNRFYNYTTYDIVNPAGSGNATNSYTAVNNPATTTFETAKGYLIRMPNNHPSTIATNWEAHFSGTPNNGTYAYTLVDGGIGNRFNLVGNPYPSPISAENFVAANSDKITGTLYFWRKTNSVLSPSYCSLSSLGFVDNGAAEVVDPNGIIQTGQGFFVEASGNDTTLTFSNAMRTNNYANQFFKNENSIEKNRIWLNATNATGSFSQVLIGYITNGTLGVDAGIDGKYINDGDIALTSLIGTDRYAIQGRPLPFDGSDIVPLEFKATSAGSYTLSIDHVDGLFANGQIIYLRDNLTGAITNLSEGSYNFTSESGTYSSRFEVLYQSTLAVATPVFDLSKVIIYKNDSNAFVINTGNVLMSSLHVYDISGRLLFEKNNINASETLAPTTISNQVLLIKITSSEGVIVTKKITS